nr:group II intron reverse transcriptase/maturase [Alistipes finegoldii]
MEIKLRNGKEIWKPKCRSGLIFNDDLEILDRYNRETVGFCNYYLIANNCVVLHNFRYIMEYSMYKTFAGKYRSTVRKINKKVPSQQTVHRKVRAERGNQVPNLLQDKFQTPDNGVQRKLRHRTVLYCRREPNQFDGQAQSGKMRIVWGNGQADYAPCPQPQRPERERELETAHVSPKTQDHCVVSELPQAAASGKSLD